MYRLLLLAEMVWITADQSQIYLDSSPAVNDVATSHVLHGYTTTVYKVALLYIVSECDEEINQSTHMCVNHTKPQNCHPFIFGSSHIY